MTDMENDIFHAGTVPDTIRLVHIADLHLGSPFSGFPEHVASLRAGLFDAFLSIVEHCERERVPLLLIAGDLFDTAVPEPALARRTADALGILSVTRVFIAAGNHDPAGIDSPYRTIEWPAHVHLFLGHPESVDLPELGVCVHGAGFASTAAERPLFGENAPARDPDDPRIHLLVLHGDRIDGAAQTPYNPIRREWLAAAGYDYAALGHVHAPTPPAEAAATGIAYSGCHAGRGFDETGERGALAVTLRRAPVPGGRAVRVVREASFLPPPRPARRYIAIEAEVGDPGDPDEAVSNVASAIARAGGSDPERHLYRITLTGTRDADTAPPADRVAARLRGSVFHLELEDRTAVGEDIESLALRHSLRGLFVRRLLQRMEETGGDGPERSRIEAALRLGLQAARGEVEPDEAD